MLRTALADGLIASAARNVDAGNDNVALFELAHVYLPSGEELPDERWHVGGIVEGGFARAKGIVEALYAVLHVEASFERGSYLRFRGPGARTEEGWVLELADDRLPGAWGLFELDVDALIARVPELVVYEDVITYPALKQDLAFAVSESITAADLVAAARAAAGPELREMEAFDVYRGEQAGEGRKSIAFRVSFQSAERTLSDGDAAALRRGWSARWPRSTTPSSAPRTKIHSACRLVFGGDESSRPRPRFRSPRLPAFFSIGGHAQRVGVGKTAWLLHQRPLGGGHCRALRLRRE